MTSTYTLIKKDETMSNSTTIYDYLMEEFNFLVEIVNSLTKEALTKDVIDNRHLRKIISDLIDKTEKVHKKMILIEKGAVK